MNTWVWGPAGCGKTSDIIGRPDIPEGMQREKDYYDKDKSKYWNGYRDNTMPVVIDDVEKDDQYMLRLLKQIAQHKPFSVEDKYGTVRTIRPSRIYVTSNYHPSEIWTNPRELETLERRFNIVQQQHSYWDPVKKEMRPYELPDDIDKQVEQNAVLYKKNAVPPPMVFPQKSSLIE